jgi:hypothetical protein
MTREVYDVPLTHLAGTGQQRLHLRETIESIMNVRMVRPTSQRGADRAFVRSGV